MRIFRIFFNQPHIHGQINNFIQICFNLWNIERRLFAFLSQVSNEASSAWGSLWKVKSTRISGPRLHTVDAHMCWCFRNQGRIYWRLRPNFQWSESVHGEFRPDVPRDIHIYISSGRYETVYNEIIKVYLF